ncbi:6-phosphogluconolactonase [Candidatus Margulisiibacteriota bacterium]
MKPKLIIEHSSSRYSKSLVSGSASNTMGLVSKGGFPTIIKPSVTDVAVYTAKQVINTVAGNNRARGRTVLGLATGGTMLPVYMAIVRLTKKLNIDWSNVHTLNLDEYIGLTHSHP